MYFFLHFSAFFACKKQTNTQAGICLTKYYNSNHQEYTNANDFINNALIGKEKLKDIVSQIQITGIF